MNITNTVFNIMTGDVLCHRAHYDVIVMCISEISGGCVTHIDKLKICIFGMINKEIWSCEEKQHKCQTTQYLYQWFFVQEILS